MSSNCIFCKVVAGEIPAEQVFADEQVVAFRDIDPQAPQHILIIPRRHIPTALDLSEEDNALVGHIFQVAAKIARQLGFAEQGYRVVNNCNEQGGQVVWHLHFHLLGGRQLTWPPG